MKLEIQNIDGEFCVDVVGNETIKPEYALIATGYTKLEAMEAAIHSLEELINEAERKVNELKCENRT